MDFNLKLTHASLYNFWSSTANNQNPVKFIITNVFNTKINRELEILIDVHDANIKALGIKTSPLPRTDIDIVNLNLFLNHMDHSKPPFLKAKVGNQKSPKASE